MQNSTVELDKYDMCGENICELPPKKMYTTIHCSAVRWCQYRTQISVFYEKYSMKV